MLTRKERLATLNKKPYSQLTLADVIYILKLDMSVYRLIRPGEIVLGSDLYNYTKHIHESNTVCEAHMTRSIFTGQPLPTLKQRKKLCDKYCFLYFRRK